MANYPDGNSYRTAQAGYRAATGSAVLDEGLRAYMLRVYNWMASGLLLTGIIALAISHTSAMNAFYPLVQTADGGMMYRPTLLAYAAIFSPMVFVMVLSFGVNKLSTQTAQALFWAFCACMGASLTNIFIVYTQTSIASVFFVTAGTFAGTSLFGYVTKTDLTKFGSFLMMGLIGIIIASLVNMFLHSAAIQFAVSIIGVLVFVGLTAYDTQRIKTTYLQYGNAYGADMAGKRSVYDALTLYLNFINLFMFLLQLFGQRNSR
ncbi:MAG: SecY protein [Acidocella sp. 20-57-95]|nr:MAG: SecY protein [Acidocella sp. 20-57-95]OYV62495.1 MAG: SecY protein [Acidocella sp. 21-58-7]HQT64078.1 Bax inhibitor-1/YccA family protein [Acidocella sp.]HQU03344.1 Bax inhibitor-1/YccA family protein [Acidocella sp.]